MKIIATFTLKKNVPLADALPLIADEERMAWRMFLKGELRETYLTETDGMVIDVFEYPSIAALQEDLLQLPLIKAGMLNATYHELRPFKNWESLFAPENKSNQTNG
ncbi:hypothetical protein [Spirosoma arcticum]